MRPKPEFPQSRPADAARVLLVEDDAAFADLVRNKLGHVRWADLSVECAGTLADALALLERGSFDLILCDLNLPDSGGLATLERLAAGGGRLIMVLTGAGDEALRLAAIEHGAYDLVLKDRVGPVELERLVRLAVLQARALESARRSEARAADDLQRFRLAMDRTGDMILLIDRASMRYVDINSTACRMLGYTREELLAMGPHDLLPVTREELEKSYDELIAHPSRTGVMNSYYRCKDGSRLQFESSRHVLRSGDAWLVAAVSRDIRERVAAENALRGSEERFRGLTELSSDIFWEQDAGYRFTSVTGTGSARLQQGPLRMAGRLRWDVHYFNMTEADWAAHRADLDARRTFRDLELGRLDDEGRQVWVSVSGAPVFDAEGAFRGYRGLGKDITERKREEALRSLEHSAVRYFAEETPVPEALQTVLGAICRTEHWGCGRAFLLDEAAQRMRIAACWHDGTPPMREFAERSRKLLYRRDEGLVGEVWRTGAPLWVPDVGADARVANRALASAAGLHGALVMPLLSHGKVVGALSISSATVREPDARLLQTLGLLCAQIVEFLERKARDEALLRFRTALDSSADMVLLVDLGEDLRLLDFNETACYFLGYARDELTRMTAGDIVAGLSQAEVRASCDALLGRPDAEQSDLQVRTYRRKDGSTFEAEVLRRIVQSQHGPILVLNARDLTERRRAEERQAAHLRYQESTARFGQSALASRDAAELVEDAVQNVREAMRAAAVAYIERGAGAGEAVLRAAAGLALEPGEAARTAACRPEDAAGAALERAQISLLHPFSEPSLRLPFEWAAGFQSAAVVPVHGEDGVRGALCALSGEAVAFGPEESKFLVAAASVLSAGLQRIDSEGRLAFLAQFDSLTGLPNRALLSDRFSQMIVQARRHDSALGVLFIDLDDFKLVNDSLGHAGGDDLLKEVAARLQQAVRPGDTVARISGDEFAVILADLARADDAALVAQKILDQLARPVQVRAHEVFVTASVGIAAFPADGDDAESLLSAADAAMYRAKQSGRNGFQFFTADINQRTRARAQLGSELRRALERDEFAIVYQPKFDLKSGRPCAAEALLRWRHPERGLVAPGEFIPVLEETGLIVAVGERVLHKVCQDLGAWAAAGMRALPVAVNLSARQFRQQDLDARILEILRAAAVDPGLIELEITESQLMHDPDHAARVIQALADAGMRVAIDDFGTGYSSLSYLTRFPVSALKIDRSFVADVLDDHADAAIVRAIIDMAHTLGFIVVAEGVETEAQATLLRSLGCEQAQGYFFARPMPEEEFRALVNAFKDKPRVRPAPRR